MRALAFCAALLALSAGAEPLRFERRIELRDVTGRIDHLAVDVVRQRLFVAELGNDSVDVVDLAAGKATKRLANIGEPQGVGYVAATDTLYVTSARGGRVHLFAGPDLTPGATIKLGDDADNIRISLDGTRAYIGYGSGAIAVIATRDQSRQHDLQLSAHPEGFDIDAATGRLFVNLPDARNIALVDLANDAVHNVPTHHSGANFPLTIDRDQQRFLVGFRNPAQLVAYALGDGAKQASTDVCNDADDISIDSARRQVYVSCGDGYLDVFAGNGAALKRIARQRTAPGARTSLFVPELDRLFLAARASATEPASVWVFRPEQPKHSH